MSTESLGGNLAAGRPVVVVAGSDTHVFAIDGAGVMNRWSSLGEVWSGPHALPGAVLPASFPCGIALPSGEVQVFAIGSGMQLMRFRSADGWAQAPAQFIPASGNGLAAVVTPDGRVHVFANAGGQLGILEYSFFADDAVLPSGVSLPGSGGLMPGVLAAVSSGDKIDVFAAGTTQAGVADGTPLHWHFAGAWSKRFLPGAQLRVGPGGGNGFAAIAPALDRVELFAIDIGGRMMQWSIGPQSTSTPSALSATLSTQQQLPTGAWPLLPDGVPAVVMSKTGDLELFAIGPASFPDGGRIVHWRSDEGVWNSPVAHDASLAAGGLGAAVGVVFGFNSGSNNSLQLWPGGISGSRSTPWVNWAENRRTPAPKGHCYPTCLEELVAIVSSAAQQRERVRAVGSSWSFSDVAVTDGYVVETNRLTRFLDGVVPGALRSSIASAMPDTGAVSAKQLIHVEAGIQLEVLLQQLDARGLAPFTMGGSSGQTLAGVISTSVHGGDFALPPVPDAVRAIHLVGPDGRQHWIEPANAGITEPTALAAALGPDVEIHYDNDWFDAALVSVGSLGIVYAVILEVTEQYHLEEKCQELPWAGPGGLRSLLADGSLFTRGRHNDASGRRTVVPRGVQVAIDTRMPGTNPVCFLTTRVAQTPERAAMLGSPMGIDQTMNDVLGAFCECEMIGALFVAAGPPLLGVVGASLFAAMSSMAAATPLLVPLLANPVVAPLAGLAAVAAATALATVTVAVPVLVAALQAAPAGTVGDLIATVLNANPTLTPELVKTVTGSILKPGVAAVDADGNPDVLPSRRTIAHEIMGPRDRTQCIARGLCREIAFDTDDGTYLDYLDAAFALLDAAAASSPGNILAGWFSMRFVGRSRAVLSPQRSKITCMVEFAGLRGLASTKPLLDQLESLARSFGGIQHWGMFEDLRRSDVDRAYPRLDTWLQVRQELTQAGSVATFDNAFTDRCGLTELPNPPRTQVAAGTTCTFAAVALNQQASASLRLRNDGGRVLRVDAITASGDFDVQTNLRVDAVTPTATHGFEIELALTFTGRTPGSQRGTLSIQTNARTPTGGLITIPLAAEVESFSLVVLDPPAGTGLALGAIVVGQTHGASLLVRNDSTIDAVLESCTFDVPAAADQIAVERGPIASGQTRGYAISYTPNASGPLTTVASLRFTDGVGPVQHELIVTLPITAHGRGARAELAPTTMDFGDVVIGSESPPMSMEVRNLGDEALTISGWSMPSHFRLLTTPTNIAADASEQVVVVFRPGVAGPVDAEISITSNSSPSPSAVQLRGVGVAQALLLADPEVLRFDEVPAGSRAREQRIVLRNRGALSVRIAAIAIAGPDSSEFRIVDGARAGSPLSPEQMHELRISFAPSSPGDKQAVLEVVHDGASRPLSIALGGNATRPRGLVPDTIDLDFGRAPVGTTAGERTLTLHNAAPELARIDRVAIVRDAARDFAIVRDTCSGSTLAPGESCTIVLSARPNRAGSIEASLEVAADVRANPVTLRTEGVAAALTWTWIGTSIDFGQTNVGVQSERQNVQLHNGGDAPVEVAQIELSDDFTFKNLAPAVMSIAAGQDMSFSIWFVPTVGGPRRGWLRVHSNAPGSPHELELIGLASVPPPVRPIRPSPITPRRPIS